LQDYTKTKTQLKKIISKEMVEAPKSERWGGGGEGNMRDHGFKPCRRGEGKKKKKKKWGEEMRRIDLELHGVPLLVNQKTKMANTEPHRHRQNQKVGTGGKGGGDHGGGNSEPRSLLPWSIGAGGEGNELG